MLKEYGLPPVEKVELVVHFGPVPQLDLISLSKICFSLQEKLGDYSIHQSDYLPTRLEGEGPSLGISQFEIKHGTPKIGMRLSSKKGDHTILLQDSRFEVSWSRVENEDYPRYPALKQYFQKVFGQFLELSGLSGSSFGEYSQAGIRYVNHLPDEETKAHELLNFLDFSNFKEHEGIIMQTSQMLRDKPIVGRLVLDLMSVFSLASDENTVKEERNLRMNLTFRGKPLKSGLEGVFDFFDRGHEAIVTTFAESLSDEGRALFREQGHDR